MPIIYKNGNIYGGASSADDVSFDDTNVEFSANNVQDAIDEVVEEKADRVTPPPAYDATSTYAIGNLVTYNNNIYQCKTTISTAEAWNSDHWTLVTPDADYLHSIDPNGNGSFSLNRKDNTAVGHCSFAEGYNTTASESYSHAEGYNTTASGSCSHSEGVSTQATDDYSHAESYNTTASGSYSHAEGSLTTASGISSHTEGQSTNASGNYSHAEGQNTTASGNYSHAEGSGTTASGDSSHVEGHTGVASGDSSHAEGNYTTASGSYSHAEGNYTTANHKSQHTFGEYNVLDDSTATASNRGNYVEIVGNGTGTSTRSNARTLDWSGNEVLAGTLTASGLVLTGSITDAVLTSPRCEIASIQQSKCYQIGNIIFYSAEFTFGSTIQTPGAVYLSLNKVAQADFCWGSLFYDTGDTIYKVAKGYQTPLWVTNGTTRTQCSDVSGKSRMFVNLTIIKA